MTTAQASILAERAGSTLLKASFANLDGDPQTNDISLPNGFGDCVCDWVLAEYTAIATLNASFSLISLLVEIADQSLVDVRDCLGISNWRQTSTVAGSIRAAAFVERNQGGVLWRMNERLYLQFPEMDINAAPTGDLSIVASVRRIGTP